METIVFQHMDNTEQLDSLLGKCSIIIFSDESVLVFEIFKSPFHVVSGISVFAVTVGAFILAGILYGFGSWLECARMVGSGSAAYGQGWETDAIAACVVGGVSFTGGIGKISGVVVGVLIFTALTYSLTILGIDTNLQFVFSGIIILVAVTLDCLKYVQKK